jgi:hypothetical protein
VSHGFRCVGHPVPDGPFPHGRSWPRQGARDRHPRPRGRTTWSRSATSAASGAMVRVWRMVTLAGLLCANCSPAIRVLRDCPSRQVRRACGIVP